MIIHFFFLLWPACAFIWIECIELAVLLAQNWVYCLMSGQICNFHINSFRFSLKSENHFWFLFFQYLRTLHFLRVFHGNFRLEVRTSICWGYNTLLYLLGRTRNRNEHYQFSVLIKDWLRTVFIRLLGGIYMISTIRSVLYTLMRCFGLFVLLKWELCPFLIF